MPRTKNKHIKKKSSRTKKPNNKSYPTLYFPKGGHLFNPPKTCPFRRRADDGGIWTDLGCCLSNCREKCNRYLYYAKMKPAEKQEHLMKQGVKNQETKRK